MSKPTVSKVPSEAGRQHSSHQAPPACDLEQELRQATEANKRARARPDRLANVLNSTRREQVAAFDALLAENEARLKSQATLHREAIEQLQQQQEREKQADRGQLQMQVNELIRWRGEVKRLNIMLRTNIAQTGKFLEACATARSQLSGSKDADPTPTARALPAAAKAGQAITASEATEPCPVGAVVPAIQPSCKPSSGSQVACDPCAATTPLQELTNGSSPISFKVASPLKPRARPIPATHKVSGVAIAAKAEGVAADKKLAKPAADPSSVSVKEKKNLMSVAGTPNQIKGSSSRAQPLSHEEEKAPTGTSSSQPAACLSACQERSSQAGSAGCKEVSSTGVSPPSLQAGVLRAAVVPLPVAAEGQLVDQPKAASTPLRAATPTPQERPPVSASVSIPDGLRNRPTPTTIAVQPSSSQALIDDLSSRMAGLRPVEGEAVVTMTSEPALSLASSSGASPIRRLPLPGTTVPQLSPVLLPFVGLPIAADLAEVTEATQHSTPSDHTMPADKHAVAAWAGGTVTASAATDTAEASFADLLLSAALHEDMGTPGCVSPILGVIEQQRSEPTPLAEAQTDAATPASLSTASDASSTELCAELDAELDAGLEDDSSISSFGEAADAPHGERDGHSWACSGSCVSSLDFGYATRVERDGDSWACSGSSVSSLDFGYATRVERDADSESSSDSSVNGLDFGGSCGQSHLATPLSFGSCGSLLDYQPLEASSTTPEAATWSSNTPQNAAPTSSGTLLMPADGSPISGSLFSSPAHVQAGCTPEDALASTTHGDGWLDGEPMSLDATPQDPLTPSPFHLSDATSMEALMDRFQPVSPFQPLQSQQDGSPGQAADMMSSFGSFTSDSMCWEGASSPQQGGETCPIASGPLTYFEPFVTPVHSLAPDSAISSMDTGQSTTSTGESMAGDWRKDLTMEEITAALFDETP